MALPTNESSHPVLPLPLSKQPAPPTVDVQDCGNPPSAASSDNVQQQGDCGNLRSIANCLALLIGLGVLASPYAIARGGWASLLVNGLEAMAYWFAALLLARCLEDDPKLANFSDVSRKAFGRKGYRIVTTLLFVELHGALVGYGVSLSENLVAVIPNGSNLQLLGLKGRYLLTFAATLILIPTVWVRNFKSLAWVSASSIVSSILVSIALVWAATGGKVGVDQPIPVLHWDGIPIVSGIYLFSYGGNIIVPSVRASMVNKGNFPKVLVWSFVIAGTFYGGVGLLGASMFGSKTESQITLNMPLALVASHFAVWANIITAMMKFTILLRPLAVELEAMLPWRADSTKHVIASMGMRTVLLIALIVVSLLLPFFAYVISFVGSSLAVTVCLILPCCMYWRMFKSRLKAREVALLLLLIISGVGAGTIGTVTSIVAISKGKTHG